MIRHVLAAVDLSETDTDVLRRADAIARHFSATLTALHVAESAEADLREGSARQRTVEEAIFSEARANFGTLTSRLGAQVSSDAMLVEAGEPHDRILSAAREVEADLIVIGANNRQSLRDRLLGGTADRVVRNATVPVLVVKRPVKCPYRKIVAAIDLETGSDHVAKAALDMGNGRLTLVHVVDLPPPFVQALMLSGWGVAELSRERERRKSDARSRLDAMARRVCDSTSVRTEVILGEAASSLLDRSRRRGTDLMVIGREERGVVERILLGSVALRLLHQAASDVLIVGRPSVA